MSESYSLRINGLDELRDKFNRIPKELAAGVGYAALNIERSLRFDIVTMYNLSESRFNNALEGSRTRSIVAKGKNVIEAGITFKQIPIDLAKFPYTWYRGNIPPLPKKRKGRVHSVSVRRGQVKIVYGKYGLGGFTIRNGSYGTQMFERASETKYPLELRFGPSIVNIVDWAIVHNNLPSFKKALDETTEIIASYVNL